MMDINTSSLTKTQGVAPPLGATPRSLQDPPSLAPLAQSLMIVTLVIMFFFLALRLYIRLRVTHSFGLDDCKPSPD